MNVLPLTKDTRHSRGLSVSVGFADVYRLRNNALCHDAAAAHIVRFGQCIKNIKKNSDYALLPFQLSRDAKNPCVQSQPRSFSLRMFQLNLTRNTFRCFSNTRKDKEGVQLSK